MIQAELDAIRRVATVHYRGGPALDVGSSDLAFRQREKLPYDLGGLFEAGAYRTFDAKAGEGVDMVGDVHELGQHISAKSIAFLICTNVLEHVRNPWWVVSQCAWVTRPDGVAIFSAPWTYGEHPDPEDHWRMNLSGLRAMCGPLFEEIEALRLVEPGIAVSFYAGRRRE